MGGGKGVGDRGGGEEDGDGDGGGGWGWGGDDPSSSSLPGDPPPSGPPSSVGFCPALGGARICEAAWEAALLALRRHRARRAASAATGRRDDGGGGNGGVRDDDGAEGEAAIDALEKIMRLQRSLHRALRVLSDPRQGAGVRDRARLAAGRSREAAALLADLRDGNAAVAGTSRHGLVGRDGVLIGWPGRPGLDALLAASFDPHINRRLLGSAPARAARFRGPRDALSSLADVASELGWGVCDLILRGDGFGRIVTILENNSLRGCGGVVPPPPPEGGGGARHRAEAPIGMNILSRSLVVLNLYFDDMLLGQYDFSDMVGKSSPTANQTLRLLDSLILSRETCTGTKGSVGGTKWASKSSYYTRPFRGIQPFNPALPFSS